MGISKIFITLNQKLDETKNDLIRSGLGDLFTNLTGILPKDISIEELKHAASSRNMLVRKEVFRHPKVTEDIVLSMYKDNKNTFISAMDIVDHPAVSAEKAETIIFRDMPYEDRVIASIKRGEKLSWDALGQLAFSKHRSIGLEESEAILLTTSILIKINELYKKETTKEEIFEKVNGADKAIEAFVFAKHPVADKEVKDAIKSLMVEKFGLKEQHFLRKDGSFVSIEEFGKSVYYVLSFDELSIERDALFDPDQSIENNSRTARKIKSL